MKRNLILAFAVLFAVFLGVSSVKKIMSYRDTSQEVQQAEDRLESLKIENQNLKQELEYKKSSGFKEQEIRNKLGLVKEGETLVLVPRDDDNNLKVKSEPKPNWEKWRKLFFGS